MVVEMKVWIGILCVQRVYLHRATTDLAAKGFDRRTQQLLRGGVDVDQCGTRLVRDDGVDVIAGVDLNQDLVFRCGCLHCAG